jgi:hypothetical protein
MKQQIPGFWIERSKIGQYDSGFWAEDAKASKGMPFWIA